jgi:frataxin
LYDRRQEAEIQMPEIRRAFMSLDESRFATLADTLLGRIADAIDDVLADEAEAEVQGGILTIVLADRSQYVVNKHAPNRQIWLSSPVSGAHHFDYRDGAWISSRDESVSLLPLLEAELKAKTGVAVDLG